MSGFRLSFEPLRSTCGLILLDGNRSSIHAALSALMTFWSHDHVVAIITYPNGTQTKYTGEARTRLADRFTSELVA